MHEPNGLLACGGDLTVERLVNAYRRGIFPWFNEGDPILWWSPDPRTVLFPQRLHISRSLRKRLRQRLFRVTMDREFGRVIRACAAPRDTQGGTWIVPRMIRAYEELHRQGIAHSVEVRHGQDLVGGLYGVCIGRAFFGESMFSHSPDASKVALVQLCHRLAHWGFGLIDCQMKTDHLMRLGAVEIPREELVRRLDRLCRQPDPGPNWDDGCEHTPLEQTPADAAG
nr:leucyl/phenylalanyl-tRNA--protein transferase [Thiocapsa imhoffii]